MKHIWLSLVDNFGLSINKPQTIEQHLAEAVAWLARAQDATPDDGVAASYDLKRGDWVASYPETTGYIIPTFYDYAKHAEMPEYAHRARRMAIWEAEIQLADGGVRAGTMDAEVVAPTIFNTGQVLFGWARAYKETGEDIFKDSLVKAADWLVNAQDEDGAWRRYASPFASHQINSYNTRSAFGLVRAFEALQDQRYLDAAKKNVIWVMSRAHENGWLEDNCLTDNAHPLTHTIAYSMRGILEVGDAANDAHMIDMALKMARAVAGSQRIDGAVPGRLDDNWKPTVNWTCVTGNSQLAINWFRLAQITGESVFINHAKNANCFNMSIQNITSNNEFIRGGIKGSFPFNGGYMSYRYPNWAAKFFMDALMIELGWSVDK